MAYQLLCAGFRFTDTGSLWDAFLFAGRWHDILGGALCCAAGAGMTHNARWGQMFGFAMTAGYANLLAYLVLMFFFYGGPMPEVFFGMTHGMTLGLFTILFTLHLLSAGILWKTLGADA